MCDFVCMENNTEKCRASCYCGLPAERWGDRAGMRGRERRGNSPTQEKMRKNTHKNSLAILSNVHSDATLCVCGMGRGILTSEMLGRAFSAGPVAETPSFQCRGHRFDPWSGN